MRKVIVFNMMSVDGFFSGPNGELDWHKVDTEFNEFANEQLNEVDVILFGRVTYQLMASYWPTPTVITNDPIIAEHMNNKAKIVFSKTLNKVEWNNTKLINSVNEAEIKKLKQEPGKDLIILGSADLTSAFINLGLIDEYRIMVNPIVLGSGRPLFKELKDKLALKLQKTKTFRSGNVLLYYQP